MDNLDITKMNDHDLIITLIGEVRGLRNEVLDMKDDTRVKVADHELRIRRLEMWGGILVGGLYALEFYFQFLHK